MASNTRLGVCCIICDITGPVSVSDLLCFQVTVSDDSELTPAPGCFVRVWRWGWRRGAGCCPGPTPQTSSTTRPPPAVTGALPPSPPPHSPRPPCGTSSRCSRTATRMNRRCTTRTRPASFLQSSGITDYLANIIMAVNLAYFVQLKPRFADELLQPRSLLFSSYCFGSLKSFQSDLRPVVRGPRPGGAPELPQGRALAQTQLRLPSP